MSKAAGFKGQCRGRCQCSVAAGVGKVSRGVCTHLAAAALKWELFLDFVFVFCTRRASDSHSFSDSSQTTLPLPHPHKVPLPSVKCQGVIPTNFEKKDYTSEMWKKRTSI